MGTPVIGLSYDPKVDGMMEIFGQMTRIGVNDISVSALKGFADDIIADRDNISASLLKKAEELERKAIQTAKLAANVIITGDDSDKRI